MSDLAKLTNHEFRKEIRNSVHAERKSTPRVLDRLDEVERRRRIAGLRVRERSGVSRQVCHTTKQEMDEIIAWLDPSRKPREFVKPIVVDLPVAPVAAVQAFGDRAAAPNHSLNDRSNERRGRSTEYATEDPSPAIQTIVIRRRTLPPHPDRHPRRSLAA